MDSGRKLQIARAVKGKKGGKYKLVYSDHFPVILTISNLPRLKEQKEERQERWNLARDGDWKLYKEISEQLKGKLEAVVEDNKLTIEEAKHKFNTIHDKIIFKAFEKVKISEICKFYKSVWRGTWVFNTLYGVNKEFKGIV